MRRYHFHHEQIGRTGDSSSIHCLVDQLYEIQINILVSICRTHRHPPGDTGQVVSSTTAKMFVKRTWHWALKIYRVGPGGSSGNDTPLCLARAGTSRARRWYRIPGGRPSGCNGILRRAAGTRGPLPILQAIQPLG
jgi:hypothetical protein